MSIPIEITAIPDDSTALTLVVEQTRAFVQVEEERIAAQRAHATTLLAVIGVIASIGGGFFATFDGRFYGAPIPFQGEQLSVVLVLVLLCGGMAISALLWSGWRALAVMLFRPDPEPERLAAVVGGQFPDMLDEEGPDAARTLLELLTLQLFLLQRRANELHKGLTEVAAGLGITVLSGIVLALLMLFGTTTKAQHVHLTDGSGRVLAARLAER